MKKTITSIFLLMLLLASCKSSKYTLSATGFPSDLEGKMVYIQTKDSLIQRNIFIDSALIKDSQLKIKYSFTLSPSPAILTLSNNLKNIDKDEKIAEFILEPGKITMDYDKAYSNIGGTPLNIDFQKNFIQVLKDHDTYWKTRPLAYEKAIDNPEKSKILSDEDKIARTAFDTKIVEYIQANLQSRIGVILLLQYDHLLGKEKQMELITQLPEEYKQVKSIASLIEIEEYSKNFASRATGTIYKEVSGETPQGKELSLSELLAENEYVLLEFWASWCAPCIKESKHINEVYEKFHHKKFEVLGLSIDTDKNRWIKMMERHPMPWKHIIVENEFKSKACKDYGIVAIPQNILISKDGTIVAKNLRGNELSAKLNELLK